MTDGDFGILIVDDEPNIRSGLAKGLAQEADRIETAAEANDALKKFRADQFQIVIADVRLPGSISGLQLVQQVLDLRPETTTIVITAHGTVETAVEAMRLGAFDFISKPIDLNLIRHQVRKARRHHEIVLENRDLRGRLAEAGEMSGIVGSGAAIQNVFNEIRQVAPTDATVLIYGESGTGKELIARALHDLSHRNAGPFIAANLGALPETLLESELFGHEKGSFSGATRQKPGCFEQACGGTLFLDEVTEMSAKSQVNLLRVLETQQFTRVGGEELLTADARIVAATNQDIVSLVENGSFREDLYYRLNVVPIRVPSLRQRRDDIPLLVEHFLNHFCLRHKREPKQMSTEAMQILVSLDWPGNVRQLRNVVERLVVKSSRPIINGEDLPAELKNQGEGNSRPRTLAEAVETAEKNVIENALAECNYHREKAAEILGISIRTLHYKMRRYGLY